MGTVEHAAFLELAFHVVHEALPKGDESFLVAPVRLVHDLSDAMVAFGRTHASAGATTSLPSSVTVNHIPSNGVGLYRAKCVIREIAMSRSGRCLEGTTK